MHFLDICNITLRRHTRDGLLLSRTDEDSEISTDVTGFTNVPCNWQPIDELKTNRDGFQIDNSTGVILLPPDASYSVVKIGDRIQLTHVQGVESIITELLIIKSIRFVNFYSSSYYILTI